MTTGQQGEPRETTLTGRSTALALARGVARTLSDLGVVTLTEFTRGSGRRVDLIGFDRAGRTTIVEIKTSVEDFRGDRKWPEYLAYCDRFYFAVPTGFPREVLPGDCGLMVADGYEAAILREAPERRLNAARRKALSLSFGLVAAERLSRHLDPR